jgi:hypothetical protein
MIVQVPCASWFFLDCLAVHDPVAHFVPQDPESIDHHFEPEGSLWNVFEGCGVA